MDRNLITICALVVLVACAQHTIIGDTALIAEADRLAALAGQGVLTETDLNQLTAATEGDHAAEHELEHTALFVQMEEQRHAAHALGMLAAYLRSGNEVMCPGHDLAHYYVFVRHGEEHEAEHSLEEIEETLDDWQEKAEAYEAEYPGTLTAAQVRERIEAHLTRIAAGDTTATDEEIDWLAMESMCIES